jgi:SAM-dependent methyltransferase
VTARTLQDVKLGYDRWHAQTQSHSPGASALESPWYQWVRSQVGAVAGQQVLEVACGCGGLVHWLAAQGAQVTGCDISAQALAAARRNGPGRFLLGDIHALPFPAKSFDMVVSCETLEHTLDLDAAIRELLRVARPGAQFFITTPSYLNTYGLYRLYLKLRGRPFGPAGVQPLDRVLFSPLLRRRFQRHGLRVVRSAGLVQYLRPGRTRLDFIERNPALAGLAKYFALHFAVHAVAAPR